MGRGPRAERRWQPITGINDDDVLVDADFRVYYGDSTHQSMPAPAVLAAAASHEVELPAAMRTVGGRPQLAAKQTVPIPIMTDDSGLTDLEREWVMGNISADRVLAYARGCRCHRRRRRVTLTVASARAADRVAACPLAGTGRAATAACLDRRHSSTETPSWRSVVAPFRVAAQDAGAARADRRVAPLAAVIYALARFVCSGSCKTRSGWRPSASWAKPP